MPANKFEICRAHTHKWNLSLSMRRRQALRNPLIWSSPCCADAQQGFLLTQNGNDGIYSGPANGLERSGCYKPVLTNLGVMECSN